MNLKTKRQSLWALIAVFFAFGIVVMQVSSTTTLSNENMENIVGSCDDCWFFGSCQSCIKQPEETNYIKCTTDAGALECDYGGGDPGETCGTPASWRDCGTYLDCTPYGCIQCEDTGDCVGVTTVTGGNNCGD